MENNKELSLEERKAVQLEMLNEIDAFCRENEIKYSLAFGTLLGAVRHKGFIPWDDDLDIMIPLSELDKFKTKFVSDNLKYIDVDNESNYLYHFSRITDKRTYDVLSNQQKAYGICIDLYIIANVPDNHNERERFFAEFEELQRKRVNLINWNSRCYRYLHLPFQIPGIRHIVKKMRDLFIKGNKYGSTNTYYALAGLPELRNKMIYDRDLFNNMTELEFEGKEYKCIQDYDYFLTLRYGDYMQLPPVENRVPYHEGHYYWK